VRPVAAAVLEACIVLFTAKSSCPVPLPDKSLPGILGTALEMLNSDLALGAAFCSDFTAYFTHVKTSELKCYELAEDKEEWQRREFCGSI